MPSAQDIRQQPAYLPEGSCDGRAQFRQVFCTLIGQKQTAGPNNPAQCEDYLWQLADEPSLPPLTHRPAAPRKPRVFVIGGAFSDCFGEASLAYRTGIEQLQSAGYDVQAIPISGRSSSEANAALVRSGLESQHLQVSDTVILIGYSKGAVDILQFLQDAPDSAAMVDAVISIAGPVWGSRVAESGAWAYDALLSHAFSGRCDPGDGGVVDSLLPQLRQRQMAENPLPANIRYYSLLAFTTGEHMSRGLLPSWQILATEEHRNDGQVAAAEGMLPGSTLLGYANADHWGVAIDIEDALPFIAGRKNKQHYPRDELFTAMIQFVSSDLAQQRPEGSASQSCASGEQQ